MTKMIGSADFNSKTMRNAAESGYATATEIADWLIKNIDMPFRDAHHFTGLIVKLAEDKECKLDEVLLSDMQSIEPRITDDIYNVLNIEKAIKSREK